MRTRGDLLGKTQITLKKKVKIKIQIRTLKTFFWFL